jgi:hypothetical protein
LLAIEQTKSEIKAIKEQPAPVAATSVVDMRHVDGTLVFTAKTTNQSFILGMTVQGQSQSRFVIASGTEYLQQAGKLQVLPAAQDLDWASVSPEARPDANWRTLTLTTGGTQLLAAAGLPNLGSGASGLFLGSADGAGWQDITGQAPAGADWRAMASSASGSVVLAAAAGERLQLANLTEQGWQWRAVGEARAFTSVSVSLDGLTLAAAAGGSQGGLWVSTDAGSSWRLVRDSQGKDWRVVSLSESAGGVRLTAAAQGLGLFSTAISTPAAAMPTRLALEAQAKSAGLVGLPEGLAMSVRDMRLGKCWTFSAQPLTWSPAQAARAACLWMDGRASRCNWLLGCSSMWVDLSTSMAPQRLRKRAPWWH